MGHWNAYRLSGHSLYKIRKIKDSNVHGYNSVVYVGDNSPIELKTWEWYNTPSSFYKNSSESCFTKETQRCLGDKKIGV